MKEIDNLDANVFGYFNLSFILAYVVTFYTNLGLFMYFVGG